MLPMFFFLVQLNRLDDKWRIKGLSTSMNKKAISTEVFYIHGLYNSHTQDISGSE